VISYKSKENLPVLEVDMEKALGNGAYGHVYPCFYRFSQKLRVAKFISKKQPQNLLQFFSDPDDKKQDIEILV